MFEQMMELVTENTKRDGAVDREEFNADYGHSGWPTVADPEQRQKLEAFVLRKTPKVHQYETADGGKGIVFFDHRGTAARCDISKLEDAELVRIASVYGKRQAGEPDPKKPKTSATNHGYTKPVTEETELDEELNPKAKFIASTGGIMRKAIDAIDDSVTLPEMRPQEKAKFLRTVDKEANDFITRVAKAYAQHLR